MDSRPARRTPLLTVLTLVAAAMLSLAPAFGAPPETVIWQHDCDATEGIAAGPNAQAFVEDAVGQYHQGQGSVRIVLKREPGMLDDGWNGWYQQSWTVPGVKAEAGMRLRFWYQMNRIEAFYPALVLRIHDRDGTSVAIRWNPPGGRQEKLRAAEKWYQVDVPLDEGTQASAGDTPGLGAISRIDVLTRYHTLRTFDDYVRWYDAVRLVTQAEAAAPPVDVQKARALIAPTAPKFPVLFVPRLPASAKSDAQPLADTTFWTQQQPLFTLDQQKDIPHTMYLKNWSGPEDQSVRCWAGWSPRGLHLYSEVADDAVRHEWIDAPDFKDADNLRLYIDLGREGAIKQRSFDGNDYVLAAVAASPAASRASGGSIIRQVMWGKADVSPIAELAQLPHKGHADAKGWSVEVVLTPEGLPGLKCEDNGVINFAASWGDTDKLTRDNELFWPEVRRSGGDDYWRNFKYYGDLVMMSETGGFTYRVAEDRLARGTPLKLWVACYGSEELRDAMMSLRVQLRSKDGEQTQSWELPLKMPAGPGWYEVVLPTDESPAGDLTCSVSLKRGSVAFEPRTAWPININDRSNDAWKAHIAGKIDEARDFLKATQTKLPELEAAGIETAYLNASLATLELFVPLAEDAADKGELNEADRLATELAGIVSRTREELKDPEAAFGAWRRVPQNFRPSEAGYELSDGAFRSDGRPFFLVGFTSQWSYHTPIIGRLGYNAMHSNHPMRQTMNDGPDQTEVPERIAKGIHRRYRTFMDNGLYGGPVAFTAGSPGPAWLAEDQSLSKVTGHFIPYMIENPQMDAILERRYRALLDVLNQHPNIATVLSLNEPQYEGRTAEFAQMFRDYLREKYASIDALNSEWQTDHASFDVVPAAKLSGSTAARRDWADCNRLLQTQHIKLLHDLVGKYSKPHLPDMIKFTSRVIRAQDAWYSGNDWEAVSQITDVVGYDSGGVNEPMMTDYMHSLAPEKALVNGETHMSWKPERHPWAEQWRMAAHGCDSMVHWQWLDPNRLAAERGYPTQEPYSLDKTSRATLDMQRLAPQLDLLSRQPRTAAILHTHEALCFDGEPFLARLEESYEALQYVAGPVRFVTGRQLAAGLSMEGPRAVKMLIVPNITLINQAEADALRRFAGAGGHVVLIDKCITNDSAGRPLKHPAASWADASNLHRIESASPEWADPTQRWRRLKHIADAAGVQRPARLTNEAGEDIFGVDLIAAAPDRLVFIMPESLPDGTAKARLLWNGKPASGVDLISNQRIEDASIELKNGETMIIQLD